VSASNGVIRIGRKGTVKFAFGEDGAPFEVDVVSAFQEWVGVDEGFRQTEGPDAGAIKTEDMPAYHAAAVAFAQRCADKTVTPPGRPVITYTLTVAEALDFLARLREQYDELVDFFRPKRRDAGESPGTSGAGLRFSPEPEPAA
jgi:hypothetical protein